MEKVTVNANEAGAVVIPSKNPEFGYIRLTQDATDFSGGWARPVNKSTLLKGAIEDLKNLNFSKGQLLDGQIVVTESFEPSNPEDHAQDVKMAGETGVACSVEGASIYRTSVYTTDMKLSDNLIAHDNGDAIKAAQAEAKAKEEAKLD